MTQLQLYSEIQRDLTKRHLIMLKRSGMIERIMEVNEKEEGRIKRARGRRRKRE